MWIQQFRIGENVNTQSTVQNEATGSYLLSIFLLLVETSSDKDKDASKTSLWFFLLVAPVAVQTSLLFWDSSLEVFRKERFVRIESIFVKTLMIVDIHLNIEKNLVQNAVHVNNEENWSFVFLPRSLICFFSCYFSFLTSLKLWVS